MFAPADVWEYRFRLALLGEERVVLLSSSEHDEELVEVTDIADELFLNLQN